MLCQATSNLYGNTYALAIERGRNKPGAAGKNALEEKKKHARKQKRRQRRTR